ncbi:hypothetical protein [Hymenobacter jeollabukensis]|uniref:STAS/SEC14 domain-containing protein n=1 Tax=Hymenobacter jeollabukensis TaxID=2025313 RepID=A0A5R8WSR7_9BACT|nr:hypothetical protein [Hymenobacter jeollabukensis]TLM93919.1 hypothetical protein FDY95_07755 [Hymenobacter jeollabukensis]
MHFLVDTPGLVISHDAANEWLYCDWRGLHDQESSQAACLLMLEALRRQPCRKILNDNSGVTRQTMQLTLWGAWWLEEMTSAGLQYLAWVFPRDFMMRQHTEQALQHIERPVVVAFGDVASAYVWLQQQS